MAPRPPTDGVHTLVLLQQHAMVGGGEEDGHLIGVLVAGQDVVRVRSLHALRTEKGEGCVESRQVHARVWVGVLVARRVSVRVCTLHALCMRRG